MYDAQCTQKYTLEAPLQQALLTGIYGVCATIEIKMTKNAGFLTYRILLK